MNESRGSMSLLSSAKAKIDNGFSRLGPKLDFTDPAQRTLMLLASRTISISNAVVLLSRHDLSTEAVPLLFSLIGIAAQMRWIAEKDHSQRAREFSSELRQSASGWFWDVAKLKEKMARMDFDSQLIDALDHVLLEHIEGNVEGLPWGHSLPESRKGLTQDELLDVAALAIRHVLKALDAFWPGSFEIASIEMEGK